MLIQSQSVDIKRDGSKNSGGVSTPGRSQEDKRLLGSSSRKHRKLYQQISKSNSCYSARINEIRKFIYWIIEEPDSLSKGRNKKISAVTAGVILTMIVISLVCFILETEPDLSDVPDSFWKCVEVVTTVTFTVEYLLRLWVCDVFGTSLIHWVFRPMNICDLLAISPMYAELLFKAKEMQGLRVLRVIRLFKLGRYSQGVRIMSEALTKSVSALYILVFLFGIGVVIFASAVYYTEKLACPVFEAGNSGYNLQDFLSYTSECSQSGHSMSPTYGNCCSYRCGGLNTTVYSLCGYNLKYHAIESSAARRLSSSSQTSTDWEVHPMHEASFTSVPLTMWWAAVTMTTVGYGDFVPTNWVSKLVGSVAMVSGMLIIALPFAIVGAKFGEAVAVYEDPIAKEQAISRLKTFTRGGSKQSGSDSPSKSQSTRSLDPQKSGESSINAEKGDIMGTISRESVKKKKSTTIRANKARGSQANALMELRPERFQMLQEQLRQSLAVKNHLLKLQILRDNLWTSVEHSLAVLTLEGIMSYDKEMVDKPVVVVGDQQDVLDRAICKTSCGLFDRHSLIRRCAIGIQDWVWFDRMIFILIVANGVILALHDYYPRPEKPWQNKLDEQTESIFIALFTVECIVKIIAQGFVMHHNAYLHDAWNWLDFIVVVTGWLTVIIPSANSDFTFLRTVRVLRPLRTLSTMPGMKALVNTVFLSLPRLKDVMLMALFLLMSFGILGIHFWGGVTHRLCRVTPQPLHFTPDLTTSCTGWCFDNQTVVQIDLGQNRGVVSVSSTLVFDAFCKGTSPEKSACEAAFNQGKDYVLWPFDTTDQRFCSQARACTKSDTSSWSYAVETDILVNQVLTPLGVHSETSQGVVKAHTVCGNSLSSDATFGPQVVNAEFEGVSMHDWDEEAFYDYFNWGITRYDHLGVAFLVIFQCVTLEGWVDIMYMLEDAFSPSFFSFIYFVSLVIIGSFFLLNITLAIVWDAFQSIKERQNDFANSTSDAQMAMDDEPVQERRLSLDTANAQKLAAVFTQDATLSDLRNKAPLAARAKRTETESSTLVQFTNILKKVVKRKSKDEKQSLEVLLSEDHRLEFINWVRFIAGSKVFAFLINSSIAANVIVLSLDKYPDPFLDQSVVESLNMVFNIVFILEFVLLHLAYGPVNYWTDSALAFDGVIVLFSIVEIVLTATGNGGSSFTAMRAFRLLRVFKLAKRFPQMRGLLAAVIETLMEMRDFVFLLFLILVVLTLIGQSFFGGTFMFNPETGKVISRAEQPTECPFGEGGVPNCVPRAHFDTFLWGFATVFQILTGENWNAVMYDGMKATGWGYCLYFVWVVVFGNFVILNLFLAILMMNFEKMHDLEKAREKERARQKRMARKHVQKIDFSWSIPSMKTKAINSVKSVASWRKSHTKKDKSGSVEFLRHESPPPSDSEGEDSTNVAEASSAWAKRGQVVPEDRFNSSAGKDNAAKEVDDLKLENVSDATADGRSTSIQKLPPGAPTAKTELPSSTPAVPAAVNQVRPQVNVIEDEEEEEPDMAQHPAARMFVQAVTPAGRSGHRLSALKSEKSDVSWRMANSNTGFLDPVMMNRGMSMLENQTPEGMRNLWRNSLFMFSPETWIRQTCVRLCSTPRFDNTIIFFIIVSSALMAFQNPLHDPGGTREVSLNWANVVFTFIFTCEMLIKVVAKGLIFSHLERGRAYLGNSWNIVDCVIVNVSVVDTLSWLLSDGTGTGFLSILQIFRLARILRPLRLISRNENLKIVVRTIYASIPDLRNLVFFSFIVFLIFGLLGVSFYKGSFYRCKDMDLENRGFDSAEPVTPLCIPDVSLPGGSSAASMRFVQQQSSGSCPASSGHAWQQWQRPTVDTPICEVHCEGNSHPFCQNNSPWGYHAMRCSDCQDSFCPSSGKSVDDCKADCSSHYLFCQDGNTLCMEECISACMCDDYCNPLSEDAALCVEQGGRWINMNQHFNNILESWVSLLEISTTEGWVDMMYAAVDSRGPMKEPRRDSRTELGISIFISFILVGSFFVLNLCVGVVINNYHENVQMKQRGKGLHFLTDQQRKWIAWQKLLYVKRNFFTQTNLHLLSPTRQHLIQIVTSSTFDNIIMMCICLNTAILGMQVHPSPDKQYEDILERANSAFAIIFNIEAAMKLYAMHINYFHDSWNCFDFLCVTVSDAFFIIEVSVDSPAGFGTTINTIRIFRIARLFRLVRFLKGLNQLVRAFILSVPKLINVGLIMGLLIYLYAVLGVNLFCKVRFSGVGMYNEQANFRTFYSAVSILIRSLTGEAWNEIMHDLSKGRFYFESYLNISCVDDFQITESNFKSLDVDGDGLVDDPMECGAWGSYVYFITYTLFVTFVVLNLFIAVILDAFEESQKSEFNDALMKCLEIWRKYDTHCTLAIPLEKALDFVDEVVFELRKAGNRDPPRDDWLSRYDNHYTGEMKEGVYSWAYYNLFNMRILAFKVGEAPTFEIRFIVAVKAVFRRIVCQFVDGDGNVLYNTTQSKASMNANLVDVEELEAFERMSEGGENDSLRAEMKKLKALERRQRRLMLDQYSVAWPHQLAGLSRLSRGGSSGSINLSAEAGIASRSLAVSEETADTKRVPRLNELDLAKEVAAAKIQRRIKQLLQRKRNRGIEGDHQGECEYGPITRAAG